MEKRIYPISWLYLLTKPSLTSQWFDEIRFETSLHQWFVIFLLFQIHTYQKISLFTFSDFWELCINVYIYSHPFRDAKEVLGFLELFVQIICTESKTKHLSVDHKQANLYSNFAIWNFLFEIQKKEIRYLWNREELSLVLEEVHRSQFHQVDWLKYVLGEDNIDYLFL